MVIRGKIGRLIISGDKNTIIILNNVKDLFIKGSSNKIESGNEILFSINIEGSNNSIKIKESHPNLLKRNNGSNNKLSYYAQESINNVEKNNKEDNNNNNSLSQGNNNDNNNNEQNENNNQNNQNQENNNNQEEEVNIFDYIDTLVQIRRNRPSSHGRRRRRRSRGSKIIFYNIINI